MGLFDFGKSVVRRTEAVLVVQQILEAGSRNFVSISGEPKKIAHELVATVWSSEPDMFSGKLTGTSPNRLSIAAIALANGLKMHGSDSRMGIALAVALGTVLGQVKPQGAALGITKVDEHLIGIAHEIYMAESAKLPDAPFGV